jgi:hypothetical protein
LGVVYASLGESQGGQRDIRVTLLDGQRHREIREIRE